MSRPRFSRNERAFLIGVPVAWALLLLLHPVGDGDFYPIIDDRITPWMTVHVGMLFFIPAFAAVVYMLLRGLEGTAARISRVSLVVFVVVYAAWETLVGIGSGILATEVNALPEAERATGSDLIQSYNESAWIGDPGVFNFVGSIAMLVALISAGIALVRGAGAPRSVAVLFGLGAVPIGFHAPPFGQVGLALFLGGVLLTFRAESLEAEPAGAPQPGAA